MNLNLCLVTIFLACVAGDLTGHLKSLGEQHKTEGHIEIREDIPDPITFHKDYILGSKPVVFKGAAKNIPAFQLWTDEYMKEKFADIRCDVEEGKKENRSMGMWKWTYKRFLETYQKEDVYMVNSLRGKLLEDMRLFPCLNCGGYSKVINDVIMWFSSGGTKSVLHHDNIDNINCLFSGSKQLYMVDKKYKEFIDFDATDGAYSKVDVDSVDLEKYPGIAQAPWWSAKMEAGDCLFIPHLWFHQVRSFAENRRNMAVNVWFYHLPKMNTTDCENNPNAGQFLKMDGVAVGGNAESVRFLLQLEVKDGPIGYREFTKAIKKLSFRQATKKSIRMAIEFLDKDGDKSITLDEVNSLKADDLTELGILFPSLVPEPDEGEEEMEGGKDQVANEDDLPTNEGGSEGVDDMAEGGKNELVDGKEEVASEDDLPTTERAGEEDEETLNRDEL